jgi:3-oxoisoapionate kinase
MNDLLISFYGDDLTGSTDAMEALSLAGLRTALFLKPATDAQIEAMSANGPLRAIGLAGTSRSETPQWMEENLPAAFTWLKRQEAAICHYKVCSTFDSAPHVGNIGCALEIGARVFEQAVVPVVVGVPQLRRYTVFGQLFAGINGTTYRIDRHPVLSRHPVTPMDEADLRLHLGRQTKAPIGLVDWLQLQAPDVDAAMDLAMQPLAEGAHGLLLDVPDRATQAIAGHQLWRARRTGNSLFTVGSSGVEYALVQAWQAAGLLNDGALAFDDVGAVEQIAVVSGSCSEVTGKQIRQAAEQGFVLLPVAAHRLASQAQGDQEQARVLALAKKALDDGKSVIAYTALGPDAMEAPPADAQPHAIGQRLGRLLRDMVVHGRLKRAIVAGGDTSSHALQELGVFALTVAMPLPLTPGSPLCTAHSDDSGFDGLQIALKGGQIGALDYFAAIRDGRK